MPMSQPEHERRTIQNGNDILSIYDMLSEMDSKLDKHTVQQSNLASQVAAHDARFDTVDARFDTIDARLDTVDARFDTIDARLDSVDVRLDSVDVRLDAVGADVQEILRRLPG